MGEHYEWLFVYDLVRALFKGTTRLFECDSLCLTEIRGLMKGKPQCGLNVAFDSKAKRSCN